MFGESGVSHTGKMYTDVYKRQEYDSIFDYSREHPEETLRVRCLVMYDFPRNISDSILTDVRNLSLIHI